jgi:DNA sulfur modification protein DndD
MFIRKIRLKNYRCYRNTEFKFGLDSNGGRNINLATGEIKAGKTTLFNAIGWCLYGIETQILLGTKIEEKDEKPVPNELAFDGDKATVEVEIDIKIPESEFIESLSIRRIATYIKGATSYSSSDFTINAYHAGEPLRISDYNKFRDRFIPKDLIQFYLFDGEYLQHTATNSNLKIRDGLRKLFNIGKIENANSTIDELVEEWYKQSSRMPKQNTRITEIDNNIAVLLDRKREDEGKIADEENTKNELKAQRDGLKDELEKSVDLQDAVNKLKGIENEEKDVEQQLRAANNTYYTNILANAYLINAKEILQQVSITVEKEPKVKSLPANVRQIFLNHLLEKERCVCGTHIGKGSREEKAIFAELKVAESEERLDFLLDLTYKVPEMLKVIEDKQKNIYDKAREIEKLENKRKQLKNDKADIQKVLPKGKVDIETYKSKINKFATLGDDISDAEINLTTYKSSVQGMEDRINELKQERSRILEKSGEANTINTNIKVGEYLKRIFTRFNKEILNAIATELQTEINNLTTQNKKISELNVKITTDNNNIDFKFAEKGSTKHYLSGGQNQLFGIIIMAAFVRIMDKRGGDKLPFVFMDNPFSSIDKGSLDIASTNLSELFKNAQVILFTTNDKFDRVLNAANKNIFTGMTLMNDGTNVKLKIQGD